MDFHVSHVAKGIERDEFAQLFFEEHLNIEMCQRLRLKRQLIERAHAGSMLQREVHMTIERRIPGWINKVIGERALAYNETMQFDFSKSKGLWCIKPVIFSSRVTCEGELSFEPHPQGTSRILRGRVTIQMSPVSAMLERYAVSRVHASFDEAAELTNVWLQERAAK